MASGYESAVGQRGACVILDALTTIDGVVRVVLIALTAYGRAVALTGIANVVSLRRSEVAVVLAKSPVELGGKEEDDESAFGQ